MSTMPPRSSSILGIPYFLLPFARARARGPVTTYARWLSQGMRLPPIPRPTPFVPDTQTFLTLIGRNLSQHASKIPSWQALFTFTSKQFKELGIEPPRSRKYLLKWRERFRKGIYGPGGHLQYAKDGVAWLRVISIPFEPPGQGAALAKPSMFSPKRRVVVNVPEEGSAFEMPAEKLEKLPAAFVKGIKLKGVDTISGRAVLPVGQKVAKIQVKEGLWENRRGRKIDGGERRRAQVQAKRRGEEKRSAR